MSSVSSHSAVCLVWYVLTLLGTHPSRDVISFVCLLNMLRGFLQRQSNYNLSFDSYMHIPAAPLLLSWTKLDYMFKAYYLLQWQCR